MGQSQSRSVLWAAQDGRVDDLIYHINKSGSVQVLKPSSSSPKKQSPIHYAAIGGHKRCIQVLYEAGSNPNVKDKDGHTPLHLAAAHGNYTTVETLLQLGADPSMTTRFGVTVLHIAASTGHVPCMELLIRWGANIDAQESWGQTPLIIATLKNRIYCMKLLLNLRVDSSLCDFHHKHTALHIACSSKDEETVLILLDGGADLSVTNGEGRSPLGVTLMNKFYRVVPLLLEYGARLNEVDRSYMPQELQNYIDSKTSNPLSLLRLCRVNFRKAIGPSAIDTHLPTLRLPESLMDFVQKILWVCEGAELKRVAVHAMANY